MSKRKLIAVAALAVTGALGTGLAQARDADVRWSVTIGSPGYLQPASVYSLPYPVYSRPQPVLVQPVAVYRHVNYQRPSRWDRDGDGIPNRRDRLYNPHRDVDGDGVPNRHDRDHDRDHGFGWRGR